MDEGRDGETIRSTATGWVLGARSLSFVHTGWSRPAAGALRKCFGRQPDKHGFNESSKTSASATDGVTPETSSPSSAAKTLVPDDPNRPETEEELEIRAGKQMMLGRKHQNEQFRQMSAAARNGTPWPPLRE